MKKHVLSVATVILATLIVAGAVYAYSAAREKAKVAEESTAGGAAENNSGLANPAAVYCGEQGGASEIRSAADGSQSGVCVFADGSECDEWAYYRGECQPGENGNTPEKSVKEAVSGLIAEKYGRSADTVAIAVSIDTGTFAQGSVRFTDENGGGLWFAAKTAAGWELAFDGNGIVPCAAADKYGFPRDMVPQCVDTENNNALIAR